MALSSVRRRLRYRRDLTIHPNRDPTNARPRWPRLDFVATSMDDLHLILHLYAEDSAQKVNFLKRGLCPGRISRDGLKMAERVP